MTMDVSTGDTATLLRSRATYGTSTYGKDGKVVTGYTDDAKLDLRAARELDRAWLRCNELYGMLAFLRTQDGECLGDHPDWLRKIDLLLDPDAPQGATPATIAELGAKT